MTKLYHFCPWRLIKAPLTGISPFDINMLNEVTKPIHITGNDDMSQNYVYLLKTIHRIYGRLLTCHLEETDVVGPTPSNKFLLRSVISKQKH